jgi:hypothetical protein
MNTYGEWRYSSIILDLGYRWRLMDSLTFLPLYFRIKVSRCPFDMRLSGLQSRFGRYGLETLSCPWRDSNPDHPNRRLLLYGLRYCWANITFSKIALSYGVSYIWSFTYFSMLYIFNFMMMDRKLTSLHKTELTRLGPTALSQTVHIFNAPSDEFLTTKVFQTAGSWLLKMARVVSVLLFYDLVVICFLSI